MKKVTMQDIADQIGVTRMTVSKCFQNSDDISAEMKEKIMSVAAKLGYVYNKQMRYRVLVLVSEVFLSKTEDFYNSLFKRLNELSGLNNMMLSLVVAKRNDEADYLLDGDFQNSDAIIVLGQLPYKTIIELKKYNLPTICVDFYYRNSGLDTITCNNFQASYNLTSYLIEKGHKEIGFVGNLNATNSINDRYLGYYKALLEQGYLLKEEYRIDDRNDKGEIIDLLLPKELPSAFVCNNDHIAYLLIRQLKKLGYQVPEQISVVGFDDVIYSSISEPTITTMRVTRKYMAEQAIKLLLRRIQNPSADIRNLTVDCNMIERESVAEWMG